MPYLVLTVVPSTIGRMSRCTPSRLTSGPWPPSRPGDLVDLVEEDDAGLLDALDRGARDAVHVDQLLFLFLRQVLERLGHLHPPLLRLALKESRQHVLEVDVDFLDRRAGDDLERRKRLLAHVELDDAARRAGRREAARESARASGSADRARAPASSSGRDRARRRQQDVEQPLFGVLRRLRRALPRAAPRAPCRRQLDEVADHRLDVAADVADLGELRGLDLHERRLREPGEPPRDLGLADAGRPDHQDVLRRDLFGQLRRQLLPPHPVAQRDRHGALGRRLADRRTCPARRRSAAASANRSTSASSQAGRWAQHSTILRGRSFAFV